MKAQTERSAIFEDKDGKSSILLPSRYIGTNLSDESIEARLFLYNKSSYLDLTKEDTTSAIETNWLADTIFVTKFPEGKKKDQIYYSLISEVDFMPSRVVGNDLIEEKTSKFEKYKYIEEVREVVEKKTTKKLIIIEELYLKKIPLELVSRKQHEKTEEETELLNPIYLSKPYPSTDDPIVVHKNPEIVDLDGYVLHRKITEVVEVEYSKIKDKKVIYRERTIVECPFIRITHTQKNTSPYGGLTLTSKATNGIASLFDENDFTIGTNFDFHIGMKNLFLRNIRKSTTRDGRRLYKKKPARAGKKNIYMQDWLTFTVGVITNSNKIVDLQKPFESQVEKKEFRGYNFELSYNTMITGQWLYGISGVINQTNNANDLTKVDYKDVSSSTYMGTTRTVTKSGNGLLGQYKTFTGYNMNIDVVHFIYSSNLKTTFGLNPYYRLVASKVKKPVSRVGFGFYIINPSNFKTLFGVFFEYDDLYDVKNEKGKDIERLTIGITLKQEFGKKKIEKL